ncbi:MAG: TonB-dependent siderophore receptor [Pseudomonadota bacterium]
MARCVARPTPPQIALRLAVSASVAAIAFTAPGDRARAQEAGDDAVQLDTLEIEAEVGRYRPPNSNTAGKTDLPIAETPQAVSVVTPAEITNRPARTVQEVIQFVPGVFGATFGNNLRNDFFQIRGFASEQQSYFADGLQLPSFAFATWRMEPFTLSSVEVVRGPSSGLYGASNPGGFVNAVTKRAGFEDFADTFVSVNQFGNVRGGFDVNRSFGDFAVRLAATGRIGDSEVDFTDDDSLAFAPSITWLPGDRTEIELYANVLFDRTNGQNFLPYVGTEVAAPFGFIDPDLFTSEPEIDEFERDQWLAGYRVRHDFDSGLSVEQKLRYGEIDVSFINLFGGGYASPPTATSAELARFNFITTPEARLFNLDNQLSFSVETGDVTHDLLFGVEYRRYALDDEQGFVTGTPLDILDPVFIGAEPPDSRFILDDSVQNQVGIYAQDALSWRGLRVLATGRVDYANLDVESALGESFNTEDVAVSGRLGALYKFDNGLAPFASFSRSFLPVVGRDTLSGEPFEPETGIQFELGLKYEIPELNTFASVSAYNLKRKNVITTDSAFVTSQIGEIRARGIEFEIRGDPLPGLALVASATFADIETIEGTELDEGNVPTATPEILASFYADYTLQEGPLKNLGAGVGLRYIGRSFADTENTLEVSDSVIVDAGLHYDLPQFPGASLAVTATNIFDNRYVASCSDPNSCFYGAGRRVLVTLGYSF